MTLCSSPATQTRTAAWWRERPPGIPSAITFMGRTTTENPGIRLPGMGCRITRETNGLSLGAPVSGRTGLEPTRWTQPRRIFTWYPVWTGKQ